MKSVEQKHYELTEADVLQAIEYWLFDIWNVDINKDTPILWKKDGEFFRGCCFDLEVTIDHNP